MKTLGFGEILFDQIKGKEYFGGAPVNVAMNLSRLGADSYMLSALGNDRLGKTAENIMKSENIRTDFINMNSSDPTGLVDVFVKDGIPSYNIRENSAWDSIQLTAEQKKKLIKTKWDLIFCGTLAQRTALNRELLQDLLPILEFKHLFFDVNLRQNYYSEEILKNTMAYTTLLKMNDEELPVVSKLIFGEELSGEEFFKRASINYKLELLILTLGAEGAEIYHHIDTGGKALKLPAEKVNVVDTVGAGDSFSGAFLYLFLNGEGVEEAGKKAIRLAAYVVSHAGALPDMDENIWQILRL